MQTMWSVLVGRSSGLLQSGYGQLVWGWLFSAALVRV